MKGKSLLISLVLLAVLLTVMLQEGLSQPPRTMSYQGLLTNVDGTAVADGVYNLTFRLYIVGNGGTAKWEESHPLVPVTDGVFSVSLGSEEALTLPFDKQYWLGISVGGGAELEPRIKLTSVPYSLNAQSVVNDAITGSKIADGQVVRSINGKTDDVTLAEGTNVAITPSGNTLTISSTFDGWKLTGNAGTNAGTHFLGTTDDQALELRVDNRRTLRLESGIDSYGHTTANVIGGYSGNYVAEGIWGATIAGGGNSYAFQSVSYANRVTAGYGSIGGGKGNTASGRHSTVGGGYDNTASEEYSTIGGGRSNTASGGHSTVGGGYRNDASGYIATVGGGYDSDAVGDYSFAAGRRAKANHDGCFVWADWVEIGKACFEEFGS